LDNITNCQADSRSGQVVAVHHALLDALDAHDEAFVYIRAGGDGIVCEPVVLGEFALFCRQQRQNRGQRVDAEVFAIRDAQLGAFREFKIVADSQPQTDRPSIRSTVTRRS